MRLMWKFVTFVRRRVARAGASDDEIARDVAVVLVSVSGAPLALGFAIVLTWLGRPMAAIPALFYFVSYELVIVYTLRSRNVQPLLYLTIVNTLLLPFVAQWAAGGFENSGGLAMLAIIGPFVAVYFEARGGQTWFVAFLVLAVFSGLIDPLVSAHGAIVPNAWRVALFVANTIITAVFICVPLRYVMGELRRVRRAVEVERQRSETLLLNILPAAIADRLKHGEGQIADRFDDVTVLFADLVGFTRLAAQRSASEVVTMLSDLFSAYDDAADRLGLEKIKTEGDRFMACSGLPVPRADHADAALALACSLLDITRDYGKATGLPLQLRVGLHSGPVLAGVIGKRKLAYDVYGDTVNVASRMESTGVPGRVQLTDATRIRLTGSHDLEPRAAVQIKGKGEMTTLLLSPEHLSSAVHGQGAGGITR